MEIDQKKNEFIRWAMSLGKIGQQSNPDTLVNIYQNHRDFADFLSYSVDNYKTAPRSEAEYNSVYNQYRYNQNRKRSGLQELDYIDSLYNPSDYSDRENEVNTWFAGEYGRMPMLTEYESADNAYEKYSGTVKNQLLGFKKDDTVDYKKLNTYWKDSLNMDYDETSETDKMLKAYGLPPSKWLSAYEDTDRLKAGQLPLKLENTNKALDELQGFYSDINNLIITGDANEESIREAYGKYETLGAIDDYYFGKETDEALTGADLLYGKKQRYDTPFYADMLEEAGYSSEFLDNIINDAVAAQDEYKAQQKQAEKEARKQAKKDRKEEYVNTTGFEWKDKPNYTLMPYDAIRKAFWSIVPDGTKAEKKFNERMNEKYDPESDSFIAKIQRVASGIGLGALKGLDFINLAGDFLMDKIDPENKAVIDISGTKLGKKIAERENPTDNVLSDLLFPIDPTVGGADYSQQANIIREQTLEEASPAGQFFGQLGYSAADMGTSLLINLLAPGGGLVYMGVNAAGDSTSDALARGATDEEALLIGTVSGTIEAATEAIPFAQIGKLFKGGASVAAKTLGKKMIVKSLIKSFGKIAAEDAAEEMAAEVINYMTDNYVMKDGSNRSMLIQKYVDSGMSVQEATKAANWQFVKDVGLAGAGGALLGIIFDGPGAVNTYIDVSSGGAKTGGSTQQQSNPTYTIPLTGSASDIIDRLNSGEEISLDEIYSLPEIIQAKAAMATVQPTSVIDTPERQKLRKSVFEVLSEEGSFTNFDSNGKPQYNGGVGNGRRLDIVIGPPASGKSSLAVLPLSKEHKSRVIDSDIVKQRLPEYNNGAGAGAVHEESSLLAKQQLEKAINAGDNIVYPTIGANEAVLSRLIGKAKEKGYSTHLTFVDLALSKSLSRLVNRFYQTGRYVDPSVLFNQGPKAAQTYETLKKAGVIDGYTQISSDVQQGEKPIVRETSETENIPDAFGLRRNRKQASDGNAGQDGRTGQEERLIKTDETENITDTRGLRRKRGKASHENGEKEKSTAQNENPGELGKTENAPNAVGLGRKREQEAAGDALPEGQTETDGEAQGQEEGQTSFDKSATASGMGTDFFYDDPLSERYIGELEGATHTGRMISARKQKLDETLVENEEFDMDRRHFIPVVPRYTNNGENRWAGAYDVVINQFNVENRDRYQKLTDDEGKTKATYCNLFAWDVTSAMGAELPHWINNETNEPHQYDIEAGWEWNAAIASEYNANALYEYLEKSSELIGYREVTPEEAQERANQGYPTIAVKEPVKGEHGHVVVIRPNSGFTPGTIVKAQAGSKNYSKVEMDDIEKFKFYTHD